MPKKRHDKALLIKPGSQSAISTPKPQNDSGPSVNDLLRRSRQESGTASRTTSITASVPPHVREVLNLPAPQSPNPCAGPRWTGPSRQRRIPGPPPPRSWLIDSRHAPPEARFSSQDYSTSRIQVHPAILPGATFPEPRSLQHLALRAIAAQWDWHAEFDGSYMGMLPTSIKQTLLTYINVYGLGVRVNPFRLLFMLDEDVDSCGEVTRLDLTGAVGTWATLKRLEKDLTPAENQAAVSVNQQDSSITASWDDEANQEDWSSTIIDQPSPSATSSFFGLKHLSLALTPGSSGSWKDLLQLVPKVPTIVSLSLAYWPQPTYTPRAAATRATIKQSPSSPITVFGGSNMYSALDNDWREAAGILRHLSRTMYCLQWLDLTGCGDWYDAFLWESEDAAGPEWNGSWRGVEHVSLGVGWDPVSPDEQVAESLSDSNSTWSIETERKKYLHWKDVEKHATISRTAQAVAQHLRGLRKDAGGRWITFDF